MTIAVGIEVGAGGHGAPDHAQSLIQVPGGAQGPNGAISTQQGLSFLSGSGSGSFQANWKAQFASFGVSGERSAELEEAGSLRDLTATVLSQPAADAFPVTALASRGQVSLGMLRPGQQAASISAGRSNSQHGVVDTKTEAAISADHASNTGAAANPSGKRKSSEKDSTSHLLEPSGALPANAAEVQPAWIAATPPSTPNAEPMSTAANKPKASYDSLEAVNASTAKGGNEATAGAGSAVSFAGEGLTARLGRAGSIAGASDAESTASKEGIESGTKREEQPAFPRETDLPPSGLVSETAPQSTAAGIPAGSLTGDSRGTATSNAVGLLSEVSASSDLRQSAPLTLVTEGSASETQSIRPEIHSSSTQSSGQGTIHPAVTGPALSSQSSPTWPDTPTAQGLGMKEGKPTAATTHRRSSNATDAISQPMHSEAGAVAGDSAPVARVPAGMEQTQNPSGGVGEAATVRAARETFAALDSQGTPMAATWTHASARQAEAGFHDASLGWVGVRADLNGGGVHASLVPSSVEAAAELGKHMDGLNSYLVEQHTPVDSLVMAAATERGSSADHSLGQGMQQGAGQGGNHGANQGQSHSTQQQNHAEAHLNDGPNVAAVGQPPSLLAAATIESGYGLENGGASQISLIA